MFQAKLKCAQFQNGPAQCLQVGTSVYTDIAICTCSHEMSLNLKFGSLRYLHVSNLKVLLVILILKI